MPDQDLPENIQRRFRVSTVDEMWFKLLTEGNEQWRRLRPINSRIPSNPRCVNCHRPFAGIGGVAFRILQGVSKSNKNPRFCVDCHGFTTAFPGGAEIVLTMLFVDVRGSTTIAEGMDPT
jgi:adenylate cyclase